MSDALPFLRRRQVVASALIAAATLPACLPAFAQARAWTPSRNVTIVVPFTTGASNDILARMLAPKLSELWGQTVVVENKPGANATIGAAAVARSPGDGHTLMISTNGVVVAPFVMKGLTYSIERDLAPIGSLVFSHIVVVGTTAIADTNLAEYITAAGIGKGRSIGVPDPFATLVATRLKLATGKPLNLIPYKGAGQVTNDLVGGQVDAGIMSVVSASTLMRAGKLRGLAVLAEERSPAYPEIPTADELGIKGVRAPLWVSVFAAGTTPAPVQQQLNRDLRQVMSDPAVQAKVREMGAVLSKESLEEFRDRYHRDIEETRQLVKAAGLTPE